MIVIKTRQPDPELEQKIRMLLEREHIEAEQISIGSQEKLVFPGLTLDGMTHEVSCNGRKTSLTRLEFCPEEIAWEQGFISDEEVAARGQELRMTEYGQYLLSLVK